MLSKNDFHKLKSIISSKESFSIAKDFLIEKNEPEMVEALDYLIDNDKFPVYHNNSWNWQINYNNTSFQLPAKIFSDFIKSGYISYWGNIYLSSIVIDFLLMWKQNRDKIVFILSENVK